MKAKSFADREIRYTLKAQGQGAGTFNIGPTSGIVKLAKELDFEDLRQPHVYSLIVTATEDFGGFSTSVEVYAHTYMHFINITHYVTPYTIHYYYYPLPDRTNQLSLTGYISATYVQRSFSIQFLHIVVFYFKFVHYNT